MELIRDGALAALRASSDDATRALILRLDRAEETIALAARSLRLNATSRASIARVLREYLAWRPTHRHKKRGSTYRVVAQAAVQSGRAIVEGDKLIVYLGEDGYWWARPVDEFNDGRFETL